MNWRLSTALFGLVGAALLGVISFALQDNIFRFFMKPRTPFQIAPTPAAPDYNDPAGWLRLPDDNEDKSADVFYVHSSTYRSNRFWNAPIEDPTSREELELIAAPNEAGPFMRIGAVFAPRYRQATKAAYFTHKYDGIAARSLAFEDVSRAFDAFLERRDPAKPIVLVGYGQGGLMVAGLLKHHFSDATSPLSRNLAAAYIINAPATLNSWSKNPSALPVCEDQSASRCVVAYNYFERGFRDEIEQNRKRAVIWNDALEPVSVNQPDLACVNPLTWRINDNKARPSDHDGAASATGLGLQDTPPKVPNAVSASCEKGILIVERPDVEYLRHDRWFGKKWRSQPFNLFYHDLAKNVALRVAALSVKLREESIKLPAPKDVASTDPGDDMSAAEDQSGEASGDEDREL